MRLLKAARKPNSVTSLLHLVAVYALLQGCSLQSWVVDQYSDYSKPKEKKYSSPAEKFRLYDKKLGKMIGLGRCAINSKSGIDELVEFSVLNLGDFDDSFLVLETQQKRLKQDRARIRSVIRSTSVDPNNFLEPYSHVSGFAEVWYDSISSREWKAIDERMEEHIKAVEELTTESIKGYNKVMLEHPSASRASLMRPLLCASAIPLFKMGAKLDRPGYFEKAYGVERKKGEGFSPMTWFVGFTDGAGAEHVAHVNKINSYREECNCYVAAQNDYKPGGARFYSQSQKFGDSLCASTNDEVLMEIEEQLRSFISIINTEKLKMKDMLDKKIISKFVEPFVHREDDPLLQFGYSEVLQELGMKSDIFYDVAKVQYAHSRRAREESNIKIARNTLACLHDARARSAGGLYLGPEFIQEDT